MYVSVSAESVRLSSLPHVRCPLPGIHYTAAVDGCLHRINVGCQNLSTIDIYNSCTVPSSTGDDDVNVTASVYCIYRKSINLEWIT